MNAIWLNQDFPNFLMKEVVSDSVMREAREKERKRRAAWRKSKRQQKALSDDARPPVIGQHNSGSDICAVKTIEMSVQVPVNPTTRSFDSRIHSFIRY